jgi:SAM-dependent methyltransferase
MDFTNCYDDATRAASYAQLEFANTYYLAYRDIPEIIREHVRGTRAVDFGCGTGRSTRFVRQLGFEVTGVDIAPEMVAKARELDPGGDYRVANDDDLSEFQTGAYDLVLSAFTFDNIPGLETKVRLLRDLGRLLRHSGNLDSGKIIQCGFGAGDLCPRMGVVLNQGLPRKPPSAIRRSSEDHHHRLS